MPRRLKISPLQRDILMTLEEVGVETGGTVVATVKPASESVFNARVDELIKLGLIQKEQANLVLADKGKTALRA